MSAATRSLLIASALASLVGAKPASKLATKVAFLDQGARVVCRQGAPVNLLDHFPAGAPRPELLCVNCACPDGFVACQYARPGTNCKPASKARQAAPVSASTPTSISPPAFKPTSISATKSTGRQIRIGSTHFLTSGQPEAARSDHERLAAEALGLDQAQFEAKLVHFKRRLEARAAAAKSAQAASPGYLTGQINYVSAWDEDEQLQALFEGHTSGGQHLSGSVWEPAQTEPSAADELPRSAISFYLLLAAELFLIALVLTLFVRIKLGQLREAHQEWLWIQKNGYSTASLDPTVGGLRAPPCNKHQLPPPKT